MTIATSAWLTWAALSICVAVGAAVGIALLAPGLQVEATALGFAVGMGWAGLTPRVLRRAGRG